MPKIDIETDVEIDIDEPQMYKVLLHNDNYTTMDFVIMIISRVFHKNDKEAEYITVQIHEKGKGLCGVYSKEIAQTKVQQVKTLAKQSQFPLLATYEIDQ